MNLIIYFSLSFTVLLNYTSCFSQEDGFPILSGPYLGQKPDTIPTIFARNIISLGLHEHDFIVSQDSSEAFYIKYLESYTIMHLQNKEGFWLSPKIATFSGKYKDMGPCFSPDGSTIYFGSTRPIDGSRDFNIWIVEKEGEVWGNPVNLGYPVNTEANECNPSVASNRNIYFQYFTDSGLDSDLYYSPFEGGAYGEKIKISDGINTAYNEAAPFIAPDESYLIFHSDRPGGFGYMDLYISYKDSLGLWNEPKNLGNKINTSMSESNPYITPDGKYLFYSNYFGLRQGYILWVDVKAFDY